jgi:pimeloyl-ACP methyl ester carboxylesterase
MGRKLEAAIGALNGVLGDYLARTGNGLATEMELIVGGAKDGAFDDDAPLSIDRASLERAHPSASSRVVVLLHGVGCTEHVFRFDDGSDYGSMLERHLDFTPYYVRFNSGLAIPDNGARLDRLLEALVDAHPVEVEEILLLGFSMGGLVARSACHAASLAAPSDRRRWLPLVRRAIYVGTPHQGAPLERAGRVLTKLLAAIPDPYTRLAAQIGDLRSEGLKDLGDADLRHEDRARRLPRFALRDARHPVPLLPSIRHHLVAGSIVADPHLALAFGDPMVPLPSATDGACATLDALAFPPQNVKVLPGVGHMALARHPEVWSQIRAWIEASEEHGA